MKIGGGGRETWMVVIPIGVAIGVSTVLLGGPSETLSSMERLAYDAVEMVALLFRR